MDYGFYDYLEANPECHLVEPRPLSQYLSWDWKDLRNIRDTALLSDPSFIKIQQRAFLEHVKNSKYSILQNPITGERIFPQVPTRGNAAHARRKRKRVQPVIDSFKKRDREFSRSVRWARPSEVRLVHAIMVTFSFTRDYSLERFTTQGYPIKRWDAFDAWESITDLVNQFKMELSRELAHEQGPEHKGSTVSYGSCLVKEGSEDMYPAPHLIVVFDNPVVAHRYGKQWLLGKSGKDRALVDRIQAIWERMAGSHCKINAIISAGGFAYAFKYIMKSVDLSIDDVEDITHAQAVCLNTHMNQSIHDLNDTIPPSFLERIDHVRNMTLLDLSRNKLKQLKAERKALVSEILEKGGFNPFTFSLYPHLQRYGDVIKELQTVREDIYRLKLEYCPWFFVSSGHRSLDDAVCFSSRL